MEELLQSLLQVVESPQTPSAISGGVASGVNRENSTRYIQEQCEDMSDSEMQRLKPWLHPPSLGGELTNLP